MSSVGVFGHERQRMFMDNMRTAHEEELRATKRAAQTLALLAAAVVTMMSIATTIATEGLRAELEAMRSEGHNHVVCRPGHYTCTHIVAEEEPSTVERPDVVDAWLLP